MAQGGSELREEHPAEFGFANPEIVEAKVQVDVRIVDLSNEPDRVPFLSTALHVQVGIAK